LRRFFFAKIHLKNTVHVLVSEEKKENIPGSINKNGGLLLIRLYIFTEELTASSGWNLGGSADGMEGVN